MEKGLNMWKHIALSSFLFSIGALLTCLYEPGRAVSFRADKPTHIRGKPVATITQNMMTGKTNERIADLKGINGERYWIHCHRRN
jgi:hypothetical protein